MVQICCQIKPLWFLSNWPNSRSNSLSQLKFEVAKKLPLAQLMTFYGLDQWPWWVWIFLIGLDSSFKKKFPFISFLFLQFKKGNKSQFQSLWLLLSFFILKFSKTTTDGISGELNGSSLNGVDERSTLNMSKIYGTKMIKS